MLGGRVVCSLFLVLSLSLVANTARADEQDTAAARIHYQAGEQYYLRGHYAQAIAEFREAFRLSKAPALLYNISQAHERAGELVNARDYLKRYIDSGETEPGELPVLREKLASLDRRISSKKEPKVPRVEPPAPLKPSMPPPVTAADETDRAPDRPFKTWKWVAAGGGAGMLVLAGLFALDGQKQEQDLEDMIGPNPPTESWTPAQQDIYDRGKRANALAVGLGIGGVALATAGVVLFIIDGNDKEEAGHARVVPMVAPGLMGAAAAWRF